MPPSKTTAVILALCCSIAAALLPSQPRRVMRRLRSSVRANAAPDAEEEVDVVVIGAGIGGLSAASILAHNYGKRVLVCEAHEHAGGCAHGFDRRTKEGTFKFDSGPSLWSGMSRPSTNPLRQVLDAIGENCEWVGYSGWGLHYPSEGYAFRFNVGPEGFDDVIRRVAGGDEAVAEWHQLLDRVRPIITAAMGTPPMALRGDVGAAFTAVPYTLSSVLLASFEAKEWVPKYLTGPFSHLMTDLHSPWLKDWLDYLSFALSGLDATGTIAAAVVYTMGDLHRPGAYLDYPVGGSEAVIDALVRGLEKKQGTGELRLRTRVERILTENGQAVGVQLANGKTIRAREGVVANAPIWDTLKLVADEDLPPAWRQEKAAMPVTGSFVHLHLGIDGVGIPADLDCHHSVIFDWSQSIEARENMYIVSIPTLFDPSLAPEGKHVVHIYAAANEPFAPWANMDRKSAEYEAAKQQAAEPLWKALELIIPDIRARTEIEMIATPLTHQRFTNRHLGTYGPEGGETRGDLKFLGPSTPLRGLVLCGDSCFPGIGVPAVAASGIIAAHTFVPVAEQQRVMGEMKAAGTLCVGRGWWDDFEGNPKPPMANGGRISLLCAPDSPEFVDLTQLAATG